MQDSVQQPVISRPRELKENSVAIFENSRRPDVSDYFGKINIKKTIYYLYLNKRTDKNGNTFLIGEASYSTKENFAPPPEEKQSEIPF